MRKLLLLLLLIISSNLFGQEIGKASYYGGKFHGRKTASGEIFDKNQLTAAHKTLPFGTMVKVTDRRTGKSVTVKINDRGPFVRGRIIDLSEGAAKALGILKKGVADVTLEIQKEKIKRR